MPARTTGNGIDAACEDNLVRLRTRWPKCPERSPGLRATYLGVVAHLNPQGFVSVIRVDPSGFPHRSHGCLRDSRPGSSQPALASAVGHYAKDAIMESFRSGLGTERGRKRPSARRGHRMLDIIGRIISSGASACQDASRSSGIERPPSTADTELIRTLVRPGASARKEKYLGLCGPAVKRARLQPNPKSGIQRTSANIHPKAQSTSRGHCDYDKC